MATPANLSFNWTESDPNYPSNKGLFFRFYENKVLIADNIAQLNFSVLMTGKPFGIYDYYATAVDAATKSESDPSNHFTVNFQKPAAPTGLTGSWA